VRARYSSFAPAPLGYATVRDYCDSAQNLPELATVNGDMKDVQRPWALKAILGTVPRGGRLLEIGAGHPHVASALASFGYDVVVVDPYDGRNRGPDSFDAIQAAHPAISFVRGLFPHDLRPEHGPLDCIYSISVLEHLPEEELGEVCEAILRLLGPGGRSIHAIDHVHRGRGSEQHLAKLRRIVSAHAIAEAELDSLLEQIDGDPDAYFLSAEAHNRWRGSTPYEDFPMRRCVSVHLCVPAGGAKR
jgi:SAM-dependent methyltransferase